MSKNLSFLAFQTPYRDSPGGTVDRNAGDMGLIPGLGRFHMLLRETIPRQIDEKSRGPQGERGLEFSRRKKGQTFFPSLHSLGLYNNNVFCLRTVSGLNLLANSAQAAATGRRTKHRRLQPAGALSAAERSYPTSEVRGRSQECQAATAQERPRGATIRPR